MYICTKYLAPFLYISRIVSGFTNIVTMVQLAVVAALLKLQNASYNTRNVFIKVASINIRILSSATVVLR